MKDLLAAIEQANIIAQEYGVQFFCYWADEEKSNSIASNLTIGQLENHVQHVRSKTKRKCSDPTNPKQ